MRVRVCVCVCACARECLFSQGKIHMYPRRAVYKCRCETVLYLIQSSYKSIIRVSSGRARRAHKLFKRRQYLSENLPATAFQTSALCANMLLLSPPPDPVNHASPMPLTQVYTLHFANSRVFGRLHFFECTSIIHEAHVAASHLPQSPSVDTSFDR